MQGEEGHFVGYARDLAGYLIYFPYSKTIHSWRDVDFHGLPLQLYSPLTVALHLWRDIPMDLEARF
jgi:hypothetical protein